MPVQRSAFIDEAGNDIAVGSVSDRASLDLEVATGALLTRTR